MPDAINLYQILEIPETATFETLKKAYYRRAKQCHPDLHQGARSKEEEFKRLVRAFDILSDPLQRRRYDEQLAFARDIGEKPSATVEEVSYARDGRAVMDTIADDILEELVVGNFLPRNATLQTLMRDLESTEKFIRFREGKTHFFNGRHMEAYVTLGRSIVDSPDNILYHYYYALAAYAVRRFRQARRELEVCLKIGERRSPPQQLMSIREKLEAWQKERGPIGRLVAKLAPPPPPSSLTAEEQMMEEMNRSIAKVMREKAREERLERRSRKQLEDKRHNPSRKDRG